MGLYVEIMCDIQKEWPRDLDGRHRLPEYADKLSARCSSHRGDDPQGHTVKVAQAEARRQGWFVRGIYAVCPNCQKKLPGEV